MRMRYSGGHQQLSVIQAAATLFVDPMRRNVVVAFDNITCPACGTQLPMGSNFCGGCGNRIPPVTPGQGAFGPEGSSFRQPYQPINPTPNYPPASAGQPSYIPTVLITLFLAIFGVIPAVRHSQMAKSRGYSQNGYWWIFGGILGGQAVLGVLFAVILPLVFVTNFANSINNLPSNSGITPGSSPTPIQSNSGNSGTGNSPTSQPQSNGSWSSGQWIGTNNNNSLYSVSCPTARFCVAVDSDGYELTYSNGSWSSGQQIDFNSNNGLYSVSCPSASFCVAVDNGGSEYTYSNGTWSSAQRIDTNGGLFSVSCPTASFCVAVDNGGSEYTYSNGTWSSGQQIDTNNNNSFNSVSCPTARFCVAVHGGYEFTYSKS